VGDLAKLIESFKIDRSVNCIGPVGNGLIRSLYSTYLSFYEPLQFSYQLHEHIDPRGRFVEILKTKEFGQFSFFTAHPGVTRGGHYHHSKTEKFLVIKGKALFCFRHMHTGETYELEVSEETSQIVETIPGWTHDITNIGNDEMIVMLWANENFNKERPDTFKFEVINKEVL
jgi:UDP-2-acetamido-2,6-beta-L-arabino-hexul-4-ose reductase